jgi:hypothetical protein
VNCDDILREFGFSSRQVFASNFEDLANEIIYLRKRVRDLESRVLLTEQETATREAP